MRDKILKTRAHTQQGLSYYLAEKIRTAFRRQGYTIAFTPDIPRPRHLIWRVNRRAGGRIVQDPHKADAVFFFQDKVKSKSLRRPNPLAPGFNFFYEDMSQSRLAHAFSRVFGYNLAVDPESYIGDIIAKSELSDTPDLLAIKAPLKPRSGIAYQRLIDSELQPGYAIDFCCPTVKGEVPLVYVKTRPKAQRFVNTPPKTALAPADEVFRPAELAQISAFCSEIGLDWGELTVLRDKGDGRIYIVGVSKTDFGPPAALSLKDKLRSVDILASALKEAVLEKPGLIANYVQADNDTGMLPRNVITRIGS